MGLLTVLKHVKHTPKPNKSGVDRTPNPRLAKVMAKTSFFLAFLADFLEEIYVFDKITFFESFLTQIVDFLGQNGPVRGPKMRNFGFFSGLGPFGTLQKVI